MMPDFRTRAVNALLGLAIGDAISWPSMFHRSRTLPAWTRRIRRDIDAQREASGVLNVPMPFSLNQPAEALDLYPTDDTEWAAWTMTNFLQNRGKITEGLILDSWRALAEESLPVRGWVSTRVALENIRKGILPPASGSDNPHYFDDGAICRAIPIGIAFASTPEEAARLAAAEAAVTNAEDGVWVAQAAAVGMGRCCSGGSAQDVVRAAVAVLPERSWSRRIVDEALRVTSQRLPLIEHLPPLARLANVEYSDGCAGPETLALALAIISVTGGSFTESVFAALAFAKSADALPAFVAALSGGLTQQAMIPSSWSDTMRSLRGVCVPKLAGCDYPALVERFVTACEDRS